MIRAIAVLTLTVSLTGCTGERQGNTPDAPAQPANTITPATAPTPPAPTPGGPHSLGKRVPTYGGKSNVTALAYKQPVDVGMKSDTPGFEWSALQARVCIVKADPEGNSVSQAPWALLYEDGTTIESVFMSGSGTPKPEYPTTADRPVPAGRCVKGWMVFEVPKGKKPGLVSYAAQDMTEPVEWTIN